MNDGRWFSALEDIDTAEYWRNSAKTYADTSQWRLAFHCVCYAFDSLFLVMQKIIGKTGFAVPRATMLGDTFRLCWEYEEEEFPTVTWKSIVEAWVKDDFEGRFWTIGVIDRMRQILWNEPFDLTWAARPEEKEIPE